MLAKKLQTVVRFRLGELLLEAGIISPDVLTQGLTISKRATMPIGRVLIMSGHVSELDVQCTLQAQASIRDGSIDASLAKELLRFSHVHQVSIEEAYKLNGLSRGLGPLPRVGKLLLAAGIVDEAGLKCGLRHCNSTAYPLGRALVELNLISQEMLVNCMNLQILMRDNNVKFLDAVRVLQRVQLGESFDWALKALGIRCGKMTHPRLGDLLVAAELLSLEDSLLLAEMGTEQDRTYGDLLLAYNLVSKDVLETAVQLQSMFNNPMFTKARAVRLLKLVASMNKSLEQVMAEFDVLEQAVTLLRAAGVIDERMLRDTAAAIKDFEQSVPEALITSGVITPAQSRDALRCLQGIQTGQISYEKALTKLSGGRAAEVLEFQNEADAA
jgi:hypothetical protein